MRRRRYLGLAGLASITGLAGCSDTGTNNSSANGSGSSGGNASGGGNGSGESGAGGTTVQNGGSATDAPTGGTNTESGDGAATDAATDTKGGEATDTAASTDASSSTSSSGGGGSSGQGGFGPETYSGSGTSSEEELDLTTGPITAKYSHSGSGNFIVNLITLEGESYQDVLLANIIGQAEGSQVQTVNADGGHKLDVQADGDWEITLEQPADPQPESLPVDASGEGPSYVGPFEFGGPTTFQGTHEGESNFIVTPIPVDPANIMVSVFNEIGQFDGSSTERVDGLAYLNVQADGAWTLSTS